MNISSRCSLPLQFSQIQPRRYFSEKANQDVKSSSDSTSVNTPPSAAEEPTTSFKPEPEPVNSKSQEGKHDESGFVDKDYSSPIGWKHVIALLVFGGAFIGSISYRKHQIKTQKKNIVGAARSVGVPDIGGAFCLQDETGKEFTDLDFRGSYTLIYFGFTMCPDVCPKELKKMQIALEKVERVDPVIAQYIKPIFISVDPSRDTPERITQYKKDWDPRITWLTGTESQVDRVAKAFRVYYSIPEMEKAAHLDYLVDHSIFFYLMDMNNELMQYFGQNKTADQIAPEMLQLIQDDLEARAAKKKSRQKQ